MMNKDELVFLNPDFISVAAELITELKELEVPFTTNVAMDGIQFRFPWHDGDVIIHHYSYSCNSGMMESYNFPWDRGDVSVWEPVEIAALLVCLYRGESWEQEEAIIQMCREYDKLMSSAE